VLLLVPLVLGLLLGVITGGKLGNVLFLQFRWPWWVIVALVIREATVFTPLSRIDGVQYVYAAMVVALIAWMLWNVNRLRGVIVVAAGTALNLLVILANGARMPVTPSSAGSLVERGHVGQYTLMGAGTNLNWLGDWIAVPGPLGGTYSPGDLVVGLGIGIVAFYATRRPRPAQIELREPSSRIVSDPP
jgi:hypothetical protein